MIMTLMRITDRTLSWFALAAKSCLTISACPSCAAIYSGVNPPCACKFGFAPASMSFSTIESCPARLAMCKAVLPRFVVFLFGFYKFVILWNKMLLKVHINYLYIWSIFAPCVFRRKGMNGLKDRLKSSRNVWIQASAKVFPVLLISCCAKKGSFLISRLFKNWNAQFFSEIEVRNEMICADWKSLFLVDVDF